MNDVNKRVKKIITETHEIKMAVKKAGNRFVNE